MNTIANVFEALTEVDTKFMKLADRECEGVSNDLKKWFKKLAVRVYYVGIGRVSLVPCRKRRRRTMTELWLRT